MASQSMPSNSCEAEEQQKLLQIFSEEDGVGDPNHVQLLQKASKLKNPSAAAHQAVALAGDGIAVAPEEKDRGASTLLQDSTSSSVAADGVASQRDIKSEEAETLASIDHNGNMCMLCSKPLPERVDRAYSEFRTDCGHRSSPTGPSKADLTKPIVEFLQEVDSSRQSITNGFCELNFAKSCADAIANKDYSYWPKTFDLKEHRLQAVAKWDARYCRLNGFLSMKVKSLQHDFEGMQAEARHLCATKYSKYGVEKMSFIDMMERAVYDDPAGPTLEDAERLAAWNCAMGDVGCDMAMCAYSFCEQSNGTVGLYDECRGWHPVHGMPF